MKTVIVGGVAGGASTGARLRRLDESAEIVVLERDHYVSFANCGLPYHIGGVIPDRDSLLLQTPESLAKALALDVRTGQDVIRIDRDAREVEVRDLANQRTYREPYDKLVLCPGAEPVRPPVPGADDPRVDVLRNIPDMDRIIAQLDKGATSAVIVGGSYIGLAAATCAPAPDREDLDLRAPTSAGFRAPTLQPPAQPVGSACSYFKMLIARAITSTPMLRETTASMIIKSLAHRLIAETSAGLNAVAVQKASDR